MPLTPTNVRIPTISLMELYGEDEAPAGGTVSSKPKGEWQLDPDGLWRFWREDE